MPQSERSKNLKKLLQWLSKQDNGATTSAIHFEVKWEITEGGASDRAIRNYIEDLHHAALIVYRHPFWRITKAGNFWLEKHTL